MKYWKVYAQCVRKPQGHYITEISKEEAHSLINSSIEDYITDENESSSITEKISNYFEEHKIVECGDFAIIMSNEKPTNGNRYDFTVQELQ